MPFEGKPLREITEAELRALVQSGMAEHLHLEYKSALYGADHEGRREHLQDMCMFANSQGGLLLIGISEQRDAQGQPTGIPDPDAVLGIEVPNPEAVLQAYDARVVSCIEERLRVESHAIPVAADRYVFAFRIPNSARKPHCVRYNGHVYFPSRRERNRYPMSVTEIKELAMTAASQLERATQLLKGAINFESRAGTDVNLYLGLIPVFFREFLIDITNAAIKREICGFDLLGRNLFQNARYCFEGLERPDDGRTVLTLMRNGLIRARVSIPMQEVRNEPGVFLFYPIGFDGVIRRFVLRTQHLFELASLSSPVALAVKLTVPVESLAAYGDVATGNYRHVPVARRDFEFSTFVDAFGEPVERFIGPLCDHIHQTFGEERSPNFTADGLWTGRE
jgi:hypothetical protein